MEFLELVRKRHSVRKYSNRPIEQEKLGYILECARLSPSAVNYQPWQFLLVKSEENKKKIQSCYNREWLAGAPLYLLVCHHRDQSWKRPADGKDHGDIDVAIATEHICLAAAEQGLGTCWVCNFDTEKCKRLLGLPAFLEPVVIVPLGYPAEETPAETTRKNKGEIVKEL